MKTKKELDELKKECEDLTTMLQGLSEDELEEVAGGDFFDVLMKIGKGLQSVVNPTIPGGPAPTVSSNYRKDIGSDKNAKVIF